MIVKVDKLSHDLRGITKINNKITFVSDVRKVEKKIALKGVVSC